MGKRDNQLEAAIRQAEWLVEGDYPYLVKVSATEVLSPLVDEIKRLQATIEVIREHRDCLDELLVCYRLGRRPSDKLLDRLRRAREASEATGGG